MDDLVARALARQEVERQTGFAVENEPLALLMSLVPEEVVWTVRVLSQGAEAQRELGARLLGSESLTGEAVQAEVDALSASETEPEVIRWLVGSLGKTRDPAPLPRILAFVAHPAAQVRFVVPDALDACAAHFSEVAEALIHLSGDPDRDVRWSAVFELAAWLDDDQDRLAEDDSNDIKRQLRRLLVTERDQEIRELLAAALSRA